MRVGLVGYGLAGEAFHAPLIAAVPGLELSTIVTRDPGRAARAAGRHPRARVVPELDALLAAGAHDLVVVATPNRSHAPLALRALEAGVPVVVDKPLATSAADGRRLELEARRRGLPLAVFHNRRWDGDLLTLRRLLAAGVLGELWRLESRFERWLPAVGAGGWRESAAPGDAGGVLFDLGTHLIDQALLLLGPATRVYAELDLRRPGAAVADDAFVALTHASGARSALWMSHAAAHAGPRLRALGSSAAYVKHGLDVQEAALRDGATPGAPGWGHEPERRWGRLVIGDEARPVPTEPGAYGRFYEELERALRDGGPPPVGAAEAVAGLELIEAALASAASGAVIEIAGGR